VALVDAIGTDLTAVYSSPAARCRQTVGPLAAAAGLPVHDLGELYEAGDFGQPAAGTPQVVLLSALSSAFAIAWPPWVGRGGWYTLRFTPGELAVTPHPPALTYPGGRE
jgi:broad specificity phosphatase PhoE